MRQEVVDRIESVIKELWPSADVSETTVSIKLPVYNRTLYIASAAGYFHFQLFCRMLF